MKIEKGKFYKSRNGQKWEVLTTERGSYYSIVTLGENGEILTLHKNGTAYNDKSESEFDLIAEWTDPVEIPWSDYPTWCKWVAMDFGGEWCGYESKPIKDVVYWNYGDIGILITIHPDYYPRNFTGDWTESLFERP
jgi:hypothetical protein